MEDYGFEYSDEEPEEQDVDIENQYYNSKGFFLSFLEYCSQNLNFVMARIMLFLALPKKKLKFLFLHILRASKYYLRLKLELIF